MAQNYKYRAIDATGKVVTGRMEANGPDEVEQRLSRDDMEMLNVSVVGDSIFTKLAPQKKVTKDELAQFCFYMNRLIAGGVPLLEGLGDVRDSVNNPALRAVIGNLVNDIETGASLSQAMRKHPKIFDNVFVSLTEAGEQSGELDKVLTNIGESIRWQDEVIRKTKKMMRYPIGAFTVILLATGFLMSAVVPPMTNVLKSLGIETLPFLTEALIAVSDFVVNSWALMLGTVVAIYVGIVVLVRIIPDSDYYIDRTTIRMPIFGDVIEKLLMSRFTTVFGMLYGAGVGVVDGLKISKGALGNEYISRGLDEVIVKIGNGTSLSDSFKQSGLFPPLVLRMIRLGEATGGVDQAMLQIKSYYDRDTNEAIETAQGVIPTVTMAFLATILIWVILAIYAPLYDAISQVN